MCSKCLAIVVPNGSQTISCRQAIHQHFEVSLSPLPTNPRPPARPIPPAPPGPVGPPDPRGPERPRAPEGREEEGTGEEATPGGERGGKGRGGRKAAPQPIRDSSHTATQPHTKAHTHTLPMTSKSKLFCSSQDPHHPSCWLPEQGHLEILRIREKIFVGRRKAPWGSIGRPQAP